MKKAILGILLALTATGAIADEYVNAKWTGKSCRHEVKNWFPRDLYYVRDGGHIQYEKKHRGGRTFNKNDARIKVAGVQVFDNGYCQVYYDYGGKESGWMK